MVDNNTTKVIDTWLEEMVLPASPEKLYDPIKYIISIGGKRIRPALVLAIGELLEADKKDIKLLALSVELFHNFTLVHDDIMDESDKRRGQATVHKKWNQNVAILSGDAMLIEVYKMLVEVDSPNVKQILRSFNDTATLVCEGQQYDMDFEEKENVKQSDYIDMIKKKTAVLLAYSLHVSALLKGDTALAEQLYEIGINLGLSFQIKDDLLDVFPEDDKFGKKVAGDIYNAKKTFLYINLLEKLSEDETKSIKDLYAKEERNDLEVEQVINLMRCYQVDEAVESLANDYSEKAITQIENLENVSLKNFLNNFSESLLNRTY